MWRGDLENKKQTPTSENAMAANVLNCLHNENKKVNSRLQSSGSFSSTYYRNRAEISSSRQVNCFELHQKIARCPISCKLLDVWIIWVYLLLIILFTIFLRWFMKDQVSILWSDYGYFHPIPPSLFSHTPLPLFSVLWLCSFWPLPPWYFRSSRLKSRTCWVVGSWESGTESPINRSFLTQNEEKILYF